MLALNLRSSASIPSQAPCSKLALAAIKRRPVSKIAATDLRQAALIREAHSRRPTRDLGAVFAAFFVKCFTCDTPLPGVFAEHQRGPIFRVASFLQPWTPSRRTVL